MKKSILLLILSLICVSCARDFSGSKKQELLSVFIKANFAYKDARYTQALNLYEEIFSDGFESGALFYNMGNCYVRQGDIGRAILNYKRAFWFIPRDGDLRANYRFARAMTNQRADSRERFWLGNLWYEFQEFFNVNEMALILVFIYLILSLLFLGFKYLGPRRKGMMALAILMTFIFLIFLLGLVHKEIRYSNLYIAIKDTEAKFEPNSSATSHYSLLQGASVVILQSEDGWLKVKRLDGKMGWVVKESLEKVLGKD